ncbi:hypothetical protein MBLNU459_g1429t1 [Dothideomycetes sp. NU459]
MSVAVFPATVCPAILRLVQIQPQKHGWEQNKSIWIEVPRIDGEVGAWDAAAPIRQVCFADLVDSLPGSLQPLAVRTAVGVSILHLAAKRGIASWDQTQNIPSRFDVSPVVALDLDDLAGVPPSDVAFNPWYLQQFATIDHQGTWRVWELGARQSLAQHGKPVAVASGATNDQVVSEDAADGIVLDDGWGKIIWAGNSHTIVTASRRSLGIFDIENKPVRLQAPELGIAGTPHWILDIQTSSFDRSILFVLTSVSLYCLRMRRLDMEDPESYMAYGASVLLQYRHFRDPEDITLRLSNYLDGDDLVMVLRSSLSVLANSYRFSFVQSSIAPILVTWDAALLHLPEASSDLSTVLGLVVQPAEFADSVHHGKSSGPGTEYRNLSMRFYGLTVITADFGVVQQIYYAAPQTHSKKDLVLSPQWKSRIILSGPRLEQADFVLDVEFAEESKRLAKTLESVSGAPRTTKGHPSKNRQTWTMIYERSHTLLAQTYVTEGSDFSRVLERVKSDLSGGQEEEAKAECFKTLSDVCRDPIVVGDLDEATLAFQKLSVEGHGDGHLQYQTTHKGPADVRIEKLADGAVLGLPVLGSADWDPTLVYNDMIENWLAPLSQRVPGRVRLAKEQLARRVAADLCLASYAFVRAKDAAYEDETQGIAGTQDTLQSDFLGSSQVSSFPTPSPTATPSLTTATSLSSHPSTLVAPEYARLQRYTTFSAADSAPAPLPKLLASKLAHWSLGGNPDEYDWIATQRQQEEMAELEDEGLTAKQRARLKRRAEKHLRRQRRETARAETMDLASSQAPEIMSSVRPATALQKQRSGNGAGMSRAASQVFALASSSQPAQSQAAEPPASQIEPGRFGGRAKPPKKKRKTGF